MSRITEKSLMQTYKQVRKKLEQDTSINTTCQSVGIEFPPKQKRGTRMGYQVFVKICRFSEELLKNVPETGGLLCNFKPKVNS